MGVASGYCASVAPYEANHLRLVTGVVSEGLMGAVSLLAVVSGSSLRPKSRLG